MVALCNYMIFYTTNPDYICFFRFLNGMCFNIQKLGSSYVHEYMDRKMRDYAFLVENICYCFGNLISPFLGNLVYHKLNHKILKTSLIYSLLIIIMAFGFITLLIIKKRISKPKSSKNEIYFPLRDSITFV